MMQISCLMRGFFVLCWSATVATASATSPPSSGAAIGSKYPVYNLTQPIEHGINSTATFHQRFQLITEFFRPGGPLLFIQSPESALVPIENDQFFEVAQELGGIVASLEHRYFGMSIPASFNGSTASYAPLTLGNVLEDAVAFINFAKQTVPGAIDSKTIVTGGSYGGNLALYFRVKRPDIFFGSFASGAITESFGPRANDLARYGSARWLSNIYYDESAEAAAKIKSAMMELYTCALIGKNCSMALPDLNLCAPTPNGTQYAALWTSALSAYRYIPQFNYPVSTLYKMPYPFQYLINATLNATTSAEVLRIPLLIDLWQPTPSSSSCIDWTSANITGQVSISVSQSWFYLQCQYYPIGESSVPEGNLLPPLANGNVCAHPEFESDRFNSTDEYWQDYWGTSKEILENTTRLVILQGGYDRVSGIGMPDLPLSDDREAARVVFTRGIAHTEDTFAESIIPRRVRPQLDSVRDMKVEIMKEWLGWYSAAEL